MANVGIDLLNLDFSGGVTKRQMEAIVAKINELVTAANKQIILEINLNQAFNDPERQFNLGQALEASLNIVRAYGIRLKFLNPSGRYAEYAYLGTSLEDEDWLNEDNWCTIVSVVEGGEF